MKKTKKSSLIILGLLLFLPFAKISLAQGAYVGVQDGNNHLWKLGVYNSNFERYFTSNLEDMLGNLFPLGPTANMTTVYTDWLYWPSAPPQSHWYLNVTTIGLEVNGTLLSPYDNTTITSTPVYAKGGWTLSYSVQYQVFYDGIWYIVNDTSSFLRQTLNLTLAFSPYGIMSVPLAPKTIDWTSFIAEFLGVMNSKGGLYNNISATALSNGYSLHVPTLGFENNTAPLDIQVKYNSNGVLTYYKFTYGGTILIKYWLYTRPIISEDLILAIIYSSVVIVSIIFVVLIIRKVGKKTIYIGS